MDELLDFDFDGQKGEGIVKLSKSAEEIEALVVPDDTPELERLALFLANGQKVQKESVVLNLARTLRAYRAEAFDRLMPILTEQFASMDAAQVAKAADALCAAAAEGSLAEANIADKLLPFLLRNIKGNGEAGQLWLRVLLALLAHRLVPVKQMRAQVLEMALAFSDLSEQVASRLASAQLFGALAAAADNPSFVASTFLEQAMALCQDTEGAVRALMCAQIPPIARAVGAAVGKQRLLPELLELCRDELATVRAAAFAAAVDLYAFWERDPVRRRAQVWPPIRALAEATVGLGSEGGAEQVESVRRVAGGLGLLLQRLAADYSPAGGSGGSGSASGSSSGVGCVGSGGGSGSEGATLPPSAAAAERAGDLAFATAIFGQCARHAEVSVRQCAASILPAVMSALGPARFCGVPALAATVGGLATDSAPAVQLQAARVAHEVAALLGREQSLSLLSGPYRAWLRGCPDDVLDALLPNLSFMFSHFLPAPEPQAGAAGAGGAGAAAANGGSSSEGASADRGEGSGVARGKEERPSRASALGRSSPLVPAASSSSSAAAAGWLPEQRSSPAGSTRAERSSLAAAESARAALASGLLQELCAVEQRVRPSWRRLLSFLEQLGELPCWFDAEAIQRDLLPPLITAMNVGVPCCRERAAAVVVHVMRGVKLSSQRSALAQRLLREFGHGSSYTQRLLFVRLCTAVMERFSAHYFQMCGYLETLLSLCSDPVSNVRLAALACLPTIKARLRVPADLRLLELIQAHLDRLRTSDPMRDVRECAAAVAEECKAVIPKVGGGPLSETDAAKLAEEEQLVMIEAESALAEAKRRAAEQIAEQGAGKLSGKDERKAAKRPAAAAAIAAAARSASTATASASAAALSGSSDRSSSGGTRAKLGSVLGRASVGHAGPAARMGVTGRASAESLRPVGTGSGSNPRGLHLPGVTDKPPRRSSVGDPDSLGGAGEARGSGHPNISGTRSMPSSATTTPTQRRGPVMPPLRAAAASLRK